MGQIQQVLRHRCHNRMILSSADTRAGMRLARGAVIALVVLLLVGLLLSGVGPDLPGPNVREWLGVAKTRAEPCKPTPDTVHSPVRPPAPAGAWRREARAPGSRNEMDGAAIGSMIYYATGFTIEGGSTTSGTAFDTAHSRYEPIPDLPVALDHALLVAHGGR